VALAYRGPFLLVFALDQQLSLLLSKTMAEAPLSPEDFAVTSVLRLTGPIRPTQLSQTIGMRPTTLSNYLRRLTETGYVQRKRDAADGRAALVSLTRKGIRHTEACFPAFSSAVESFRKHLEDEGIVELELLASMEAMSRAIARAVDDFA
jgi:DNA-binding MarR family transcriptional regulator